MTATSALSDSINNAISLVNRLQELLDNEQQALGDNNAEAMQELLPIKLSLLSELELNASERHQMLDKAGIGSDYAAVQEYIQSTGDEKLLEAWNTLIDKLKGCQSSNTVNGKIIHRSRQQIDTLLNLLRGQSENQKLYTQSGSSTSVNPNQPFAKA